MAIGGKMPPGSRYFPFYTRPWIADADFDPPQDPHITGPEARAVDYAIDMYNEAIQETVEAARARSRTGTCSTSRACWTGWRRAASSTDPNARPAWWTPYPLPPPLKALIPCRTRASSRATVAAAARTGGLFSLDGVHPTTVGYGLIAQEMINVMRGAGVEFRHGNGALRSDPVTVNFDRLILRDSLIRKPPQILKPGLDILGWADEALDWVKRALR